MDDATFKDLEESLLQALAHAGGRQAPVLVHAGLLTPEIAAGLERAMVGHPGVATTAEMIRFALKDWLIGQGCMPHREDPEGAN